MRRILPILLMVSIILSLTACKQNTATDTSPTTSSTVSPDTALTLSKPLELAGQWEQVDSEFEGRHLGAVISGDTIEIYWIDDDGETRILYWAGTFTEPVTAEEPYSWVSRNNTKKTELSLGASRYKTKGFTYDNNQISCSVTSNDYIGMVHMEKAKWAPDLEENEFDKVEKFSFPAAGIEFSIPSYFKKDMEESEDGNTTFYLDMEGLNVGTILGFIEFPSSQQEYEVEKAAFIEYLCAGDSNIVAREDIILAGFPGLFFAGSRSSQNDITVPVYGALTYNVNVGKALLVSLVTLSDDDYTCFFDEIINDARVIGQMEASNDPTSSPGNGIRSDFKDAMDSYEAFIDEYIAFMERYANSDDPLALLTDYTDYMTRYTETMTALSEINDGSLSTEELDYYIEVQSRIAQKLLAAAQ